MAENDRPAFSRLELISGLAVVGVLALVLGLVALATPTTKATTTSVPYTQSGAFTYHASASAGSAYGPKGLTTGQPIITPAVGPVTVAFAYTLKASSADVRGTGSMVATVDLGQGLKRSFPVAARSTFSGTSATLSGTLPTAAIQRYVKAAPAIAQTGAGTTVTVTPKLSVRGTVAGRPLHTSFSPNLSFTDSGDTLSPTSAGAPGSDPTATPPNQLKPTKTGKIRYEIQQANHVSLLVAHPGVTGTRIVGFALFALCLLLCLWLGRPLLKTGDPANEGARIRTLYGSQIVEVRELSSAGGPIADLASMESLAELAKRYESMIMHVADSSGTGEAYLLWDNGMTYRYRPAAGALPRIGAGAPASRRHPTAAKSAHQDA